MIRRLETFTAGVKILAPMLDAHGFHFEGESTRREPSLVGLGPEVAFGEFVRGDRRLLVEFVYSLGPVKYYVGDLWIEHAPYAEVVTLFESLRYPEFMDDFERKILEVARRKATSP